MSFIRTGTDSTLRVILFAVAIGAAAANAAELGRAPISADQSAAVVQTPAAAHAPASREKIRSHDTAEATPIRARVPLDLRVPELGSIMSHSQLLDELRDAPDEQESVEVVAATALVPMGLDTQIPLGVVGSLQWSVDHPLQVWRIFLPNPNPAT
jgi:hypothetical protein